MKNFVAFGTIGAIAASSSFGQCVPVRSYVDIIPAEGAVVTNQVGVAAALAGSFNLRQLATIYAPNGCAFDFFYPQTSAFGEVRVGLPDASAFGLGNYDDHCGYTADAYAHVRAVSSTWPPEMEQGSTNCRIWEGCWCCPTVPSCPFQEGKVHYSPIGVNWTSTSALLTFHIVGSFSVNYVVDVANDGTLPDGNSRLLYRFQFLYFNGTPRAASSVIASPYGSILTNAAYDVATMKWSHSDTFGGTTGDQSFELRSVDLADSGFDVNHDRRMNHLDYDALQSLVGTTVSEANPWDLNADGVISAADLVLFAGVLAAGGNQGILGDLDGDGIVDCSDYDNTVPALFGFNLGDNGYRFSLDANLDGKTDLDDYAAVRAAFYTADFDHDGFVVGDDYDAFSDAFAIGAISADFNRDGFVNGEDFDAYIVAFENGC